MKDHAWEMVIAFSRSSDKSTKIAAERVIIEEMEKRNSETDSP